MRLFAALTAATLLFGCSSSDGTNPDPEPSSGGLELDPPENGFQLRTVGTTIQAGEDTEYCEVVEVPGSPDDTYWVKGFETKMTEFSHHLIVSGIQPGSETEALLDVGHIEPCKGAHQLAANFTDVFNLTGAQQPYRKYDFPAGVGKVVTGGTKIIVDYHYLNTSDQPIQAGHAINFVTTTEDQIDRIGQRMAFVNVSIDTPARSEASFVGECTFSQNGYVGAITRHTHRWGTDFTAWHVGGERDGEHIWTSRDWELDVDHDFGDPILVREGEGFRFQCDFNNTTDQNLKFGSLATDEMCILFGLWWKEKDEDDVQPQICVMFGADEDGIARGFRPDPGMLSGM